MSKKKIYANIPVDLPEQSTPCAAQDVPQTTQPQSSAIPATPSAAPSLSQLSITPDAISISDAADKIEKTANCLRQIMADIGRVESTFHVYRSGCDSVISRLAQLSFNLKEVMEAAHQPVFAGLSDDTVNAINAIPGNVAQKLTEEVGRDLRGRIYSEVREGFRDLDKRRRVCALPWPVFVPLMLLLGTLIVVATWVYLEASGSGLDSITSIFSTCLEWLTGVLILIAIIYGIWLANRG